jgi:hypothetical protein
LSALERAITYLHICAGEEKRPLLVNMTYKEQLPKKKKKKKTQLQTLDVGYRISANEQGLSESKL